MSNKKKIIFKSYGTSANYTTEKNQGTTGKVLVDREGKLVNIDGVELTNAEALTARVSALEAKPDKYVTGVSVTGNGTNEKTITFSFSGGAPSVSANIEDLNTVTPQYDDTELRNKITALETQAPTFALKSQVPTNEQHTALSNRVTALETTANNLDNTYAAKSIETRVAALEATECYWEVYEE